MNFDKKIISEIKQPYFFFKGKFDKIDSKYFIPAAISQNTCIFAGPVSFGQITIKQEEPNLCV